MAFTEKQELASNYEFDKNVLVSAGAGSGKTKVLSTRITNLIKDNKAKPTELLVLTFTKLAASEMKERIRNIMLDPKNNLLDTLPLLEQAYITNFDSFTLSFCKKYYMKLNIIPNPNIIDEVALNLKKREIVTEEVNKLFEEKNEVFLNFVDKYTNRTDNRLISDIVSVISKFDALINPIEVLDNYEAKYLSDDILKSINDSFYKEVDDLIKKALEGAKNALFYVDSSSSNKINKINLIINGLTNVLSSKKYEDILDIDFDIRQAKDTSDNFKEIFSVVKIKDDIKDMITYMGDIFDTKNITMMIVNIIKNYYKRIYKFMDENGVYTYNDIQRLVIKLLKEDKEVREKSKEEFKYIFIDEYQDTSDLQEEMIKLFSNNNVFMVGDIKQSIYNFRNANPSLFKKKYNDYTSIDKDIYENKKELLINSNGYLIDMNDNFRSRESVIDNINTFFSILMTDELGDANYRESHKMTSSNPAYNKNDDPGDEIIEYDYDKSKSFISGEQYYIEGYLVAQSIIKIMNSNKFVYDPNLNDGEYRNYKYDDFCILCDTNKPFEKISKVLEYFSIPSVIKMDIDVSKEPMTVTLINLIKLVAYKWLFINKKDLVEEKMYTIYNHAYLSVARSFLFELSDDELYHNIIDKSYNEVIDEKIINCVNKINTMSNSLLYTNILESFGFYEKVIKYNDLDKSLRIAELIYDKIESISNLNYDFYDVMISLSDIIDNNERLTIKNDISGKHGVKLMNIHQSKGLEFPVCYYVYLNNNLNETDKNKSMDFDINGGIRIKAFKEGIIKTPLFYKFKNDWENKEYSEHLRKFYVALTRAREKKVFIKCNILKKKEKEEDELKENSFVSYFKKLESEAKDYILSLKNYDSFDIDGFLYDYYNRDKNSSNNILNKITVNNELDYKNEELNIKYNPIKKNRFSKEIHKINTKQIRNNIDNGIYYHKIMECIDFKNPFESLKKLDLDDITFNNINKILNLDIIKKLKDANRTFHEHEFIYNDTVGSIDLLAEYDDYFMIIDYKLSNIDDIEYINQLNGYKNYIKSKTKKDVKCYLLSLLELNYKEIK